VEVKKAEDKSWKAQQRRRRPLTGLNLRKKRQGNARALSCSGSGSGSGARGRGGQRWLLDDSDNDGRLSSKW
jgi:hypothetical protein